MAQLLNIADGRRLRPATRCLVGRAPNCHLVLVDASISREHAVLFYESGSWFVRDLSSRNGTTIDAKPVRDGSQLTPDAVVRFGSDGPGWKVIDADEPLVRARSDSGTVSHGNSSGLFIPNSEHCEAFVSRQDGQWWAELDGEVRPIADEAQLTLRQEVWTLELTLGEDRSIAATAAVRPSETWLTFNVSPDEEHVAIVVEHGGLSHPLSHRSHSYLLLTLARARLEDRANSSLGATEHGWLETKQLAKMLKTSSEQINLWIFRAREQLQRVDLQLAEALVERRPTLGQLRLGFSGLRVVLG